MRQFLAIVILGGALAVTAAAAFADDSVHGFPPADSAQSVTLQGGTQSAAMAGEYQNPTNPFRQENIVK